MSADDSLPRGTPPPSTPGHATPPIELTDRERDELTAYLDGELDEAGSRRVEERLTQDEHYRGLLQSLDRSWEMLEHLDRATVSESFTQTTVEMVARDAAAHAARPPRPSGRQLGRAAATVLIAAFAAFAAGRALWPDPNSRLLEDLPVLDNIELYDQGDSLDFLKKLERSGLFSEEAEHGK